MDKIDAALKKNSDKEKAKILARYFKTGKGEYGEGDVFLGVVVPKLRVISKEFWKDITIGEIQYMLKSDIHEKRLLALLMLIEKYKKADETGKKNIFDIYLASTRNINNWDLVDLSCRDIIGAFLINKDRSRLCSLAKSQNIWEKRIAIISTYAFIQKNDFEDTFKIAEILLIDKHDLIHKAVGWMLRETGKRNQAAEEEFLKNHYTKMPRTMLRYAIERFDEGKRRAYLDGEA